MISTTTATSHSWRLPASNAAQAPASFQAPGEDAATGEDAVTGEEGGRKQTAGASGSAQSPFSVHDLVMLQRRRMSNEETSAYRNMLARFDTVRADGTSAVAFVQSLSQDDIDLLKHAHSLAQDSTIDTGSLNEEQAMNLIMPDSKKVDLNNDGLTANAAGGYGVQFPPVNAPQAVNDAWKEATAAMSEGDRFLLEGRLLGGLLLANIHRDEAGRVTVAEPDSPEWRNPFAAPDFDYRRYIDEMLQANEFSRPHSTAENYQKTKESLTAFKTALAERGVA